MKGYSTEAIIKRELNRRKIKKIIRICSIIITIPVLFFNIVIISTALSSPTTTPNFFGYKIFVIMSGSMEPTLNIQDIIVVKHTNKENIKANDIIAYREEKTVITHRITEIEANGCYQTRGDNNNTNDSQVVKYEQIEGVYTFKIPKLGAFVSFLKTGLGVTIIFVMVVILCRNEMAAEKKRQFRKEKRAQFEIEERKKDYGRENEENR